LNATNLVLLLVIIVLAVAVLLLSGILEIPGADDTTTPPTRQPGVKPQGDTGSGGKDQGGKTMQVARSQNAERDACHEDCDKECGDDVTDCRDDCEDLFESVCQQAGDVLAGCNFGCQFIPIPPGPGLNPRVLCFEKCLDAFKQQCDEDDYEDCVDKCPSGYQTCLKDCYRDC